MSPHDTVFYVGVEYGIIATSKLIERNFGKCRKISLW